VKIYYDTGLLLKLYTPESDSGRVQQFVIAAGEVIPFLSLHRSECASALHLKVFRGECDASQANRTLNDIQDDTRSGLLRLIEPDWEATWQKTLQLTQAHIGRTGCRTLDTQHVASALTLGFRQFATSDHRQSQLAETLGLVVHNPAKP